MLEISKWIAVGIFLIASIMMFNQNIAAKSAIPWSLFFVGNMIMLVDNAVHYNLQWLVLSACFCVLNAGIIIQRIRNQNVLA